MKCTRMKAEMISRRCFRGFVLIELFGLVLAGLFKADERLPRRLHFAAADLVADFRDALGDEIAHLLAMMGAGFNWGEDRG